MNRIGKRVIFKAPNVVEVEKFKVRPINDDEVLIKTVSTLISPGTETAFLQALPNTPRRFPQYPGYSNAGIVVEVGKDIQDFKVGDRVVSPTSHSSFVIANEQNLFKIPNNLSFDEAAFFNLTAIALQGVRKAQIEIGNSVLVLGLGLVGQLAAQLAKLNGAFPVIGVDLYDFRLKVAKELGTDYVINPKESTLISRVKEITEGKGADIVLEVTGNPDCIPLALKLAKRCGKVILLGSTRGESTVNFYSDVHRKGITIIGAHNSVRPRYESFRFYWTRYDDCKLALKLIANGRIRVKELISLKVDYTQAAKAYEKLIKAKNEVIGVILDWRNA